MPDIQALLLLSQEAEKLRTIKGPPDTYSETAPYRENTLKIIDGTVVVVKQVNDYADEIYTRMKEVSEVSRKVTVDLQKKIKHLVDSLVLTDAHLNYQPSEKLKQIHALEKMAREVSDRRLDELIAQTQAMMAKIQAEGGLAEDDLSKMKGCLDCWVNEQKISFEEKERLEEERRRAREEEERRKREEEERRKREAEEERKRQEEERRRREEERKREEEERRRREAEEQDEDRKRKLLEEERLRAEEARRLKEEKERQEKEARLQRQREEKRRREEEERNRKEEERLERERKQREEEERRRRLDPENWTPNVYKRPNTDSDDDADQVDGSKSYHKGICCVISAPDGALNKDDVQCLASDEVDDVIETLYDGERLASSVISIDSNNGNMDFEVPIRVHVPHATPPDSGDEVVFKYSINGSDEWMTQCPASPTKKSLTSENVKLSCLELASLGSVKVVVVVRPRGETIMVDRPGVSQYLAYDKNIKLFIPRETYSKRTEIRVTLKNVPLENYSSVLGKGSDSVKEIISTSSLITLNCQKPTGKDIEVDLIRKPDESSKTSSGKRFHLFRGKENVWKVAKSEYKNKQKDVSVHLPSSRDVYSIIELVMPEYTTPEMAIEAAKHVYDLATKTVVSVLVKQKTADPAAAVFQCVRRDQLDSVTSELTGLGFGYGGGVSREFCMQDGEQLHIRFSGNVQKESPETEDIVVPFSSLIDKTRRDLRLAVIDRYKQKDLSYYVGSLQCTTVSRDPNRDSSSTFTVEIQLQIPKEERQRTQIHFIPVRFPHTLSVLSKFLSAKLTSQSEVPWMNVLSELDTPKEMARIDRQARSKVDPANERDLCETIIKDWMKSQPKSDDKAIPVFHALRMCGLSELAAECETVLDFFSEYLSDKVLKELCQKMNFKPTDVGQLLNMTSSQVDECVKTGSNGNEDPNFLLLQEWRESDAAINEGANALNYLENVLQTND